MPEHGTERTTVGKQPHCKGRTGAWLVDRKLKSCGNQVACRLNTRVVHGGVIRRTAYVPSRLGRVGHCRALSNERSSQQSRNIGLGCT